MMYTMTLPSRRHLPLVWLIWTIADTNNKLTLVNASSSHSTAWYPFSYRNEGEPVYYRAPANILSGIAEGEFSELYIQYHGCVWSEYGAGVYDGSNELMRCGDTVTYLDDANDNNDGDDDTSYYYNNQESPSYWYLGATQCFRPNVAYTLYGVKAGGSVPTGHSPCSQKQYIDSFFTKYGIESFGDGVGLDYESYGVSSYCQSGNDYYRYYNMYINDQDMYPNAYSYGAGCSADGFFELVTYSGAFCNGQGVTQTTNQLYFFNSNLEALGCVKVYDASVASKSGNDDDAVANDDANQQSGSGAGAKYLLSRSVVCSISEYPERCPDPHGIKAKRDAKLYHRAKSSYHAVPIFMPILTAIIVLGSALLFWLTFRPRPEKPRNRWEQVAASFDRGASFLAVRTITFKERLLKYAEEMEEEEILHVNSYEYVPPKKNATSNSAIDGGDIFPGGSSHEGEIKTIASTKKAPGSILVDEANGMSHEQHSSGLPPISPASKSKLKYKRPVLARVSRSFFRRNSKAQGAASAASSRKASSSSKRTTRTPLSPVSECSEPPPTPMAG